MLNSNIISDNNKLDQDDLFLIGDAEIDNKGLVHHHLSSSNDLYDIGISQIISQVFNKVEQEIINQRDITVEDKDIEKIFIKVKFKDTFISKPTTIDYFSGKEEIIYPNRALLEEKTYSGNLRVNIEIKATAYMKNGTTKERTADVSNFKICI